MSVPAAYRWDGEAFAPLPRFRRWADQNLVVGQVYTLAELEERSGAAHRRDFASVREAWTNLPEAWGARFPSPEHLRKHALIRTRFADETQFVASSKAEAIRLASFLRPIDEYSVVTVKGNVVSRWTAKSQSYRAMGKEDFHASMDAVLGWLATLIGVEPAALAEEGRRIAA